MKKLSKSALFWWAMAICVMYFAVLAIGFIGCGRTLAQMRPLLWCGIYVAFVWWIVWLDTRKIDDRTKLKPKKL